MDKSSKKCFDTRHSAQVKYSYILIECTKKVLFQTIKGIGVWFIEAIRPWSQ